MLLNPIPGALTLLGAASTPTSQKVTHARFLILIVGVMVVFLGALALLTVLRMLRRRTAARLEGDASARASGGGVQVSAWQVAGQRATPVPAQSPSKPDEEDDGDADDDSGEFPPLDDTDFGDDDDGDDDDESGPPGRFG